MPLVFSLAEKRQIKVNSAKIENSMLEDSKHAVLFLFLESNYLNFIILKCGRALKLLQNLKWEDKASQNSNE